MKNLFARFWRRPKPELVPYYDIESKVVSRIPKTELAPGSALIRIEGMGESVYVDTAKLRFSDYKHSHFEGAERTAIEGLVHDLADVIPMSYEQWEDGFRRDRTPGREIAGWVHLAAILNIMSSRFSFSPEKRKECYRVLVACFTGDRSTVLPRSEPKTLTHVEIQTAIGYFYEGGYK